VVTDISADLSVGASGFECTPSRHLPDWLAEQRLSLAFTTYQAGKLFLVGVQPSGRLSIFERTFNRCMGLWSDGQTIWMSSLYQLWRFENVLQVGQLEDGFDRLFVPHLAYTTGDLDIHDVSVGVDGNPIFVNTLFSCLAQPSERKSFKPVWQPSFISALAAEDRCHLNGLAMDLGKPRYTTAVAEADVADGWRDHRREGGVVIDVGTGNTVLRGLSMPHSPRIHDGSLWLLDSGQGYFGRGNVETGQFERLVFCPGYLRGLSFHNHFAIVGLSQPRENGTFLGLPLEEALRRRNAIPQCALMVIDLKKNAIVHWLKIGGPVHELYDVVCMPGTTRPKAIGLRTDEICRIISIEGQ